MRPFTFLLAAAILALIACQQDTASTPPALQSQMLAMASIDEPPGPSGQGLHLIAMGENSTWLQGSSDEQYLLLKVQAGRAPENEDRSPLNIALVIDRSGSMEQGDKLGYAKQAAALVVGSLTPADRLAVVTYDDAVDVLSPAGQVHDAGALKGLIQELVTGGSTNLSGGMMEGFAQVHGLHVPHAVQRVLLLSDGLANKGITGTRELERLVRERFDADGIAISTFGVGADFNEDLMTSLAEEGRGNYYFIDSPAQIPGIFEKELNGLLNVVAHNATIGLQVPGGLTVSRVYGAAYDLKDQHLTIGLHDILSEEEKLVLIAFRRTSSAEGAIALEPQLTYEDVTKKNASASEKGLVAWSPTNSPSVHAEHVQAEVMRRLATFQANERLEEAQRAVDRGDFKQAGYLSSANAAFMDSIQLRYSSDDLFERQRAANGAYWSGLGEMEDMNDEVRRTEQKKEKMLNYTIRKNK